MTSSILRAEAKVFSPTTDNKPITSSPNCNRNDICRINEETIASKTLPAPQEHDRHDATQKKHNNVISGRGNSRNNRIPKQISSSVPQKSHNEGNPKQKERNKKLRAKKDIQNPEETTFTQNERSKGNTRIDYQKELKSPRNPPLSTTNGSSNFQLDPISRQIQHKPSNGKAKRNKWSRNRNKSLENDARVKDYSSTSSCIEYNDLEIRVKPNQDPHDLTLPLPKNKIVIDNTSLNSPWLNAVTRQEKIELAPNHISNHHELSEMINKPRNHVESDCSNTQSSSLTTTTEFIVLRKHKTTTVPAPENKQISAESMISNDVQGCKENSNDSQIEGEISVLTSRLTSSRHIDITKLRNRWWDLLQDHYEAKQNDASDMNTNLNFVAPSQQLDSCNEVIFSQSLRQNDSLNILHLDSAPESDVAPDDVGISRMVQMSLTRPLYLSSSAILIKAIRGNDLDMIRQIINTTMPNSERFRILQETEDIVEKNVERLSPVQVAVTLNRPQVLEILLQSLRFLHFDWNVSNYEKLVSSPLFIASEHGYDECLDIILSSFNTSDSTLLMLKDDDGNTAMHFSCRKNVSDSTFQLLFERATKAGSGRSFVAKILSCKNLRQQTPLHVACSFSRGDVIDCVLSKINSITTVSKLLSIQDDEGQTPLLAAVSAGATDIVMSLLMWRGNNCRHNHFRYIIPSSNSKGNGNNLTGATNASNSNSVTSTPPCPLTWAITRTVNVEIVILLLEFNNPLSDRGYDLDVALRYATSIRFYFFEDDDLLKMSQSDFQSILTIIRVLIEAGANPCSVLENEKLQRFSLSPSESTAVATSARYGDYECLVLMLDTYRHVLKQMQQNRRRDPTLRKQPESFFANLEARENNELHMSVRDALVTSLYHCWELSVREIENSNFHRINETKVCSYDACCLVLYRRGASLTSTDTERLKSSIVKERLIPSSSEAFGIVTNIEFKVSNHIIIPRLSKSKNIIGFLPTSSLLMIRLPWYPSKNTNNCGFAWMENHHRCKNSDEMDSAMSSVEAPDVLLRCPDGVAFQCHSFLLSEKSQKIAAAIRFASLSVAMKHPILPLDMKNNEENGNLLEVSVDIPSKMLRWMLEHIYHGSIIVGRFSRRSITEYFDALLELLLIADEFLCTSLVKECEMRLLAVDYRKCFCWYCNSMSESDVPEQSNMDVKNDLWTTKQYHFSITGPSLLVTVENALDILAIAQQLCMSCDVAAYTLRMDTTVQRTETEVFTTSSCSPLEALRSAAVTCMLQGLGKVIDSKSFTVNLHSLMSESTDESDIVEQSCFGNLIKVLLHELHGFSSHTGT